MVKMSVTVDGPSLTDPKLFELLKKTPVPGGAIPVKKVMSKYFNIVLLIGFVIFFIFFLFGCKSGFLSSGNIDPTPFNLADFK